MRNFLYDVPLGFLVRTEETTSWYIVSRRSGSSQIEILTDWALRIDA